MTIKLVSSLMHMAVLKAREHAVALVYADHAGEILGYEQACFPGQLRVRRLSRLGNVKGVQRAQNVLEAIGMIRVHRDQGRNPNLIELNHRFIASEGHHWDQRWDELRDQGRTDWEEVFEAEQQEASERLYREGVPASMRPRGWPRPLSQEEIAAVMKRNGYGSSKAKKPRAKGDTVSGQAPSEGVCADNVSGQNVENRGAEGGPRSDNRGVRSDNEAVCADSMVSDKPLEPNKTPSARERAAPVRRQKPGEGVLDRPEQVQVAFQRATIHWMRTNVWAAPPGYNGEMGPAPDDPDAEERFGLGPRRLFELVTSVIRPARDRGRHYLKRSPSAKLASNLVEALQGPNAAAIRERMVIVEALKDSVTAAKNAGRWQPPAVPHAAGEAA